jgi:hypothetical protein
LTEGESNEYRRQISQQWKSLEGVAGYLGRACGIPRGAFDPRGRLQTHPLVMNTGKNGEMKKWLT